MSTPHNSSPQDSPRGKTGASRLPLTLLLCFFILAAGAALTHFIFSTEPKAVREGQSKETAMLVDVVSVDMGTYAPNIQAMGNVEPAREVMLEPRVEGLIVERSAKFTPGEVVRKGDVLIRIDPADYENALRRRKSELRQAITDLEIEMGRQKVAREDYDILGENVEGNIKALVLRKPQLEAAEARVAAAEADVEQARLDLERTVISAPFDALVMQRNVDLGSRAQPGEVLGQLVGVEAYWVEARIPLSKLRRLTFPDANDPEGSEVLVRDRLSWPEGEYRPGRLYKLVGSLEEQTRFARVLITVEDPLNLKAATPDAKERRLILGAFVEVLIEGKKLSDVVRLDRDYLRASDTVWVKQDGRLDIRRVGVAFQDTEYAYIDEGLENGEEVVITDLATVAQGAALRVEGRNEAEAVQ